MPKITVYLPYNLHERLTQEAQKEDRSLSKQIVHWVRLGAAVVDTRRKTLASRRKP